MSEMCHEAVNLDDGCLIPIPAITPSPDIKKPPAAPDPVKIKKPDVPGPGKVKPEPASTPGAVGRKVKLRVADKVVILTIGLGLMVLSIYFLIKSLIL